MKRILFYCLRMIAFCCRLIDNRLYMNFTVAAHRSQGVYFEGFPSYIQADAYLDPSVV